MGIGAEWRVLPQPDEPMRTPDEPHPTRAAVSALPVRCPGLSRQTFATYFDARYNPDAPPAEHTGWTWYDPSGVELPTTRYFYRVSASSAGPSGWMKAGLHLAYHDNGRLQSSTEYRNSRMDGRVQRFTNTGQIVLDATYTRGELRGGTRSICNAAGQIKGWDDGGAESSVGS